MTKKILGFLLLLTICSVVTSCRKNKDKETDPTLNYFPLKFGKYVTYEVDSTYYYDTSCERITIKSQMKYAVTDTFTDKKKRTSYIMDVFTRPYDGANWKHANVIIVTPTTEGLMYYQDNAQYIKMVFPVANDVNWFGNKYVNVNDSLYSYLKDWNYAYKNYHLSYFNGLVNFENTVTVTENVQNVNYPSIDSAVNASATYAKEVYAYNVGMIYKEWTHTTYAADTVTCLKGYRVVMRAIDHN